MDEILKAAGITVPPCFVERKRVRPVAGEVSTVGVSGERPIAWGNYFTFADGDVRCGNMWAENLEHIASKLRMTDVEILVWTGTDPDDAVAVVVDARVPKEYLNDSLYLYGSLSLAVRVAAENFVRLAGGKIKIPGR